MLCALPELQGTPNEGQQQGPHPHLNIALLPTAGGSVQLLLSATPIKSLSNHCPKQAVFVQMCEGFGGCVFL